MRRKERVRERERGGRKKVRGRRKRWSRRRRERKEKGRKLFRMGVMFSMCPPPQNSYLEILTPTGCS